MFEKFAALVERIAVALEAIAISLKNAQVEAAPKPASAKSNTPAAAAPAPAAAAVVAPPAPALVDDGLGLDDPAPASVAEREPTEEDVLKAGRAASNDPARGRAFVKTKLNALKVDSVKELKPEQRKTFIDSLTATA